MSSQIPVFTNEAETESVLATVDAKYHAELSKFKWYMSRSGVAVRDGQLPCDTGCPYESMGFAVLNLSGQWPKTRRGLAEAEVDCDDDSLYPSWVDADEGYDDSQMR